MTIYYGEHEFSIKCYSDNHDISGSAYCNLHESCAVCNFRQLKLLGKRNPIDSNKWREFKIVTKVIPFRKVLLFEEEEEYS